MKDAEAVGYFTAATKIMMITMSISSSLGAVIMPRTSNLIAEGRMDEFRILIQKSYDFVLALAMPLTVGLIFTSPSIILLLSGEGFAPAVLTSQIVASNILMVGLSGVMGIQVLYPLGKINIVILCTLIGAAVNVFFNVLLIPRYGHNGTAVAYMLAEVAVTVSMFLIGRKYIPIQFLKKQHLHYVGGGIVQSIHNKKDSNHLYYLLYYLPESLSLFGIKLFLPELVCKHRLHKLWLLYAGLLIF